MDINEQSQPLNAEQIEEIVIAVQTGRIEQYRLLVLHFQRRMHLYCYHMLGNRVESEDAVQEVFLKCYRMIEKYRNSISFSAWMYKIAYNHCLNLINQRKGQQRLMSFIMLERKTETPAHHSTLVEEILDGLSAGDRQLLILRTLEERSFTEISEITGTTSTTLRKKFERIKKKINKKHTRKEFFDEKQSICPES